MMELKGCVLLVVLGIRRRIGTVHCHPQLFQFTCSFFSFWREGNAARA